MSDQSSASMFDYDARPVTPQVVIVGLRASSVGYQIRDFLSRNGVPYEWVDIENPGRVQTVLDATDVSCDRLPICLLPDGPGGVRPDDRRRWAGGAGRRGVRRLRGTAGRRH